MHLEQSAKTKLLMVVLERWMDGFDRLKLLLPVKQPIFNPSTVDTITQKKSMHMRVAIVNADLLMCQ
jgi:hypothetical protein